MKSYIQFIKENNYIQEKLDATVYGEVKYGASASKPKSKSQISNMVSTAVDDVKAGKPVKPAGKSSASKRKLSFGGSVSLNYEKKSGGGKTPPPTKVRPDKTTDPKTPKNTKDPKTIKTVKTVKTVKAVKGGGGRPDKTSGNGGTSTPSPSTNVLTKGSNTSSSSLSTSVLQKGKTKPSTPVRPVREV